MAQLRDYPDYSYRDDPSVPDFDDSGPVAVMDGACALCSWGARRIARMDRKGEFRICPLQSPLGSALAQHYGLSLDDPETWLFLSEGKAWTGMQAILNIARRLGGIGRLAQVLLVVPRPGREWIYRRIARNRYLFGKTDMCSIPDEALARKLIG